jgi:uncharacterized protein (DUF1501 family)
MDKAYSTLLSRRQFIRQAACAAVGTAAISSTIRDLRMMNAMAAQCDLTDYKALVCIFLAGGNDSNNLIIPSSTTEYASYAAIRDPLTPVLAIPKTSLLGISPLNPDGHSYGLHPCCGDVTGQNGIAQLFSSGKLAFLFNAGTLSYPLTKAQYNSTPSKRPPQLFSHADQVTQWQTSIPDQAPLTGWGGRVADVLNCVQPGAPISLSVSLAGANTLEVGNQVAQYSVSTSGAISLQGVTLGTARYNALTNVLAQTYPNMQAQAFGGVGYHAINTGAQLNSTILPTADPSGSLQFWSVPFPGSSPFQVALPSPPTGGARFNSSLGPQLKMIARLIEAGHRSAASGGFGMRRQIFFCSVGGYDLHSGQTNAPVGGSVLDGSHSNLLAELSQCMWAFQNAMNQIGTLHGDPSFAQRVTAFTSSDFGRTFPSNGQGSDHGWGSHHMIMGGAVNGNKTYGTFPTLAVGGPDDTSTGRWIPTTACDQYFATLATWFGVDGSNISSVFPNLGRFASPNLGFV